MKTLIFTHTLYGHNLEYINHLYNGTSKYEDETFIFAVPENEWEHTRGKREWPHRSNIRWVFLDDEDCKNAIQGSKIKTCWNLSKLIKRVAIKENVDRIKLISLASAIPFLPLLLPNNIKLSGIIYKIYLRTPQKKVRSIIDRFRYKIMANNGSMDKVFILNDPRSTQRLNDIYNSDNFVTIADPVPVVGSEPHDLRTELGIPPHTKVYLHFGAMDERKGTLEILRALEQMTPMELKGRAFIFAGRIDNNIKDRFYKSVDINRQKDALIIVKDEFCSFEFIHSLCHTCNYILMPYLQTGQSSGVLGYAAIHGKPVIGPKTGLIGELIADNGLGITIDVSSESLKYATLESQYNFSKSQALRYIERNSKERFVEDFLA